MDCVCPLPAALGSPPVVECPENLGQIQKLLFVRKSDTATFADETTIVLIINWTPLLTAVDDTKVVATHFFENHIIPQAEPITEGGGDNTTLNGVEQVLGVGPITVTGNFRNVPNAHIKALKALICEDLSVFMVNNNGKIIGKQPGGTGTGVFPIDIYTWFIADAGSEGLNTADKANFRYSLVEGWRDDIVLFTPTDFNARTELGPL